MAPVEMELESESEPEVQQPFTVVRQKVDLDVSFSPQRVIGATNITVLPLIENLRALRLQCRQLKPKSVTVNGVPAKFKYNDLYHFMRVHETGGARQYHFPKRRIDEHRKGYEDELTILMPDKVRVQEIDPYSRAAEEEYLGAGGASGGLENGLNTPGGGLVGEGAMYSVLQVEIKFELNEFRDGVNFVGMEDGDAKYPHAYTRNSPYPGIASCLFPCLDDGTTRCIFDVVIRYPRTLGDVFKKARPAINSAKGVSTETMPAIHDKADSVMSDGADEQARFSEEEEAIEMSVICSGEMTDDISDASDSTRKTASFSCRVPVDPRHIGFAIGPFEHVDLSSFRNTDDDERLGSNAIRVNGFCLPGRAEEVRNSAMVLAGALDKLVEKYQAYPFDRAYKLAFVDDLPVDVVDTASLSICSSRLLFPQTVWEPLDNTTRILVHAVVSQWIGVGLPALTPLDQWVVYGCSWWMTDDYLRELLGKNDNAFRRKTMMDEIVRLDVRRPSLYNMGERMDLDPAEVEFMELKAPMVLSILHNRLVKAHGKNGVDRCIWRMMFNARSGKLSNNAISTAAFTEICEKVGHQKLDAFFEQWVYGCGTPSFEVQTSFNKKKLVINLTIKQVQHETTLKVMEGGLASENFMREAKERAQGIYWNRPKAAFVGPMTVRIHEADGTPYEHIVDINAATVKVEIPYNTKYKRLKRNRRQKERAAAARGVDLSGESQDEPTIYALGDVLDSSTDVADWRLSDWDEKTYEDMENESYEWMRLDTDFEWICRTHFADLPSYMYVSQLQQDKDVVAQVESIQYLQRKEGHPLISTFLVRTLMDDRYFWGVRTLAAEALVKCAFEKIDWIGFYHLSKAFRTLYGVELEEGWMTKTNDFSQRREYIVQCAIPKAISHIKGEDGKAPMSVKRFLLDLIRSNDNSGNEFSDAHYIATLMSGLANCLTKDPAALLPQAGTMTHQEQTEQAEFSRKALEEVQRHQRLDEWIPTYQNICTITGLDCHLTLMKNNVLPTKPSDFLQYTRPGNADNVRLKAWSCLIELDLMQNNAIMRLLLHNIETDASPYFRRELLRILDLAIGQAALGELEGFVPPLARKPPRNINGDVSSAETSGKDGDVHMGNALPNGVVPEDSTATAASVANDSFYVEREPAAALRPEDELIYDHEQALLRRRDVEQASVALRREWESNEALQAAFGSALHSTTTSASDITELLEICSLLYKPEYKLVFKTRMPRYWKVTHEGHALLHFTQTDKVRWKPRKDDTVALPSKADPKEKPMKLTLKKPAPNVEERPQPKPRLSFKIKTPSTPQAGVQFPFPDRPLERKPSVFQLPQVQPPAEVVVQSAEPVPTPVSQPAVEEQPKVPEVYDSIAVQPKPKPKLKLKKSVEPAPPPPPPPPPPAPKVAKEPTPKQSTPKQPTPRATPPSITTTKTVPRATSTISQPSKKSIIVKLKPPKAALERILSQPPKPTSAPLTVASKKRQAAFLDDLDDQPLIKRQASTEAMAHVNGTAAAGPKGAGGNRKKGGHAAAQPKRELIVKLKLRGELLARFN